MNLSVSFEKLKLVEAIERVDHDSIFVTSVKSAISDGNTNSALAMMRDQVQDNESLMRRIFGDAIINRILAL